MANIQRLPDELLSQILFFIPPEALQGFAFTSPRFYKASYVRLQEHKELRARYQIVQLKELPEYHKFLSIVLLTDAGFYVEEVHMLKMLAGYWQKEGDYKISESDLDLFDSAMKNLPYIDPREVDKWMSELWGGNEDPVMAILLPLLPNLHTLTLKASSRGDEMDFLSNLVRHVALAKVSEKPESISAFQKLLKVKFDADNEEGFGFNLETIARFLALPSVRRVEAEYVTAFDTSFMTCKDFIREEDLPLSKIDSCIITRSNISLKSLKALTATIQEPVKIVVEAEEPDEDRGMSLYEISITRERSESPLSAQLDRVILDQYLIDGV